MKSENRINKILIIKIGLLNLIFIWILGYFTNDIPVTLRNGEIVVKNKFNLQRIRILASCFEDDTYDSNNNKDILARTYNDPIYSFYKTNPKTKGRINERKICFMKKIYPNIDKDGVNYESQFFELRNKVLAPIEKRNQGLLEAHHNLLNFGNYVSDMKSYGLAIEEVKKNIDSFRNTCESQILGIKNLLSSYMDSCGTQIKEVRNYIVDKYDFTNNLPEENKYKDTQGDFHANSIYSKYYSDENDSKSNDDNSSLAEKKNSEPYYDENYGASVDENKKVYDYTHKNERSNDYTHKNERTNDYTHKNERTNDYTHKNERSNDYTYKNERSNDYTHKNERSNDL
ncbi:Plasmodium exported protein, unknown function [Plasmodium berghei]|uniref:Uncharacterized protein n=1 Tax=Plasmodium berghei TaxID=5821 RepID=A0A1D3Q2T6_PLABE|nr:Plasmodium exported protein, unknown function [Plasmodium berghei]